MSNFEEIIEGQRKSWNKFAPGWKKWDSFMMKKLQPIGEALLDAAKIRDGHNVLDVATGTGEPGLTAARRVGKGKVIGIDLAEEMIRVAKENAESKGIKNYGARVIDATALPFEDNSFDAGICRFGIMFFPNPQAAIKEMVRVLKPNGVIALSVWASPTKNPWLTVIAGIVNTMLEVPSLPSDAPGVFRFADIKRIKSLFEMAGLRKVNTIEIEGESIFESPEQYWQVMTEVAAPIAQALNKVGIEQREQIKKAVINAAKQYEKDGRVVFGYSAWVASGVK